MPHLPFPSLTRALAACAAFLLSLAFPPLAAFGHDSPDHVAEQISQIMRDKGTNATLLVKRALEYHAHGENQAALDDLKVALRLAPANPSAQLHLVRTLAALGQSSAALQHAQQFSRSARLPKPVKAELLILTAELHRSARALEPALTACKHALSLVSPRVDWILLQSDLLNRLNRHDERLDFLASARTLLPGGLLDVEYVEALLDAAQWSDALHIIEPELAECRWKASWLLRRARANIGLGNADVAQQDLEHALDEINSRFNPLRPDPTLLIDRGRVHALMQNRQAALADLRNAAKLGTDPWLLTPLKDLLTPPTDPN